ncbi:hypothetical protein [Mesorhizobium sp. SP-1A]|uniref:hypothetical protein n=1 Tax=Mesorhizobium sp. SP-1A TaxID=3077840 RepID=UPI0028F6DD99|nr:hypothetical protein [Mesorhizobium sp. SP-1A]
MTATSDKLDLWRKQANDVAHHLSGTTKSLEQGISDVLGEEFLHLEDNREFLLNIDDKIFTCVTCGWWYENSENAGERQNGFYCFDCDDGWVK